LKPWTGQGCRRSSLHRPTAHVPASETGLRYVEGPEGYTPRGAADAFSEVLDIAVEVETIPRQAWERAFAQFGFSKAAAQSYACMTGTVADDEARWPDCHPERGTTTLRDYIQSIVVTGG